MTTTNTGQDRPGRLALEDGTVVEGVAFGAVGRGITQTAEVVFSTGLTGYQESLSDPSFTAQILVLTTPLIGNTGVNAVDLECPGVAVSGLVVRELARSYSNARATGDLSAWLAEHGVLGLTGVDTRALTRRIRVTGAMRGVISDDPRLSDAELVEAARQAESMAGANLVPEVGCTAPIAWEESLGSWGEGSEDASGRLVLAMDCGAKRNILRNLVTRGCRVEVVPHGTPASEILARIESGEASGLFVSNGPGDPAAVDDTIATLREVLTQDRVRVPMLGICLGFQMMGLAIGGETFKLKFGHRGVNQPVLNLLTGRVEITSQNHGFAVEPKSVEAVGARRTHVNLNDGTLAGFCLVSRPVIGVQHHPEASPGPHDAGYVFDAFVRMMADQEDAERALMHAHGAPAGAS